MPSVDHLARGFYKQFDRLREDLAERVGGMELDTDRRTYATVLLNRLVAAWFLQKKGFLDNDVDYLWRPLREPAASADDDARSCYRAFLRPLFHHGLGGEHSAPPPPRPLGVVPRLGLGIFREHPLERQYRRIRMPDSAIAAILTAFERYHWHLDDSPIAGRHEMTPDVLGYILEQDVNRKPHGAYYTGADVTGYMCRQSILPAVLEGLERAIPDVLSADGPLMRRLRADPGRYVAAALRHGQPDAGPGEDAGRLPGETAAEAGARLGRYGELVDAIGNGSVATLDEWLSANLDLARLLRDTAAAGDHPTLLRQMRATVAALTIVDPTCGSGAFLLAALDVLEPLMDAAITGMQSCLDRRPPNLTGVDRAEFQAILDDTDNRRQSPSRRHAARRSIIVGSLFGVDLVPEAAEICRLRLHLKLLALVDRIEDVEPLPALVDNIRIGNALVGPVRAEDPVENADLFSHADAANGDDDEARRPFRWFAEFPEIMRAGGFDIVVGNPPYVEYAHVRDSYEVAGYRTQDCNNLYAYCTERSIDLLRPEGWISLVLPLSTFSTPNMQPVLELVRRKCGRLWVSYYSNRPSQLFHGSQNFLAIMIGSRARDGAARRLFTTRLLRWTAVERPCLFALHRYAEVAPLASLPAYALPKFSADIENRLAAALFGQRRRLSSVVSPRPISEQRLVYCYGGVYWTKARTFDSPIRRAGAPAASSADRPLYVLADTLSPAVVAAILNSSLHFWFWCNFSDCRNKTYRVMLDLPIPLERLQDDPRLAAAGERLMREYVNKSETRTRRSRRGRVEFEEFYPRRSKAVIDEIDGLLAAAYGFDDDILDFIVNYDLKYRMGRETLTGE